MAQKKALSIIIMIVLVLISMPIGGKRSLNKLQEECDEKFISIRVSVNNRILATKDLLDNANIDENTKSQLEVIVENLENSYYSHDNEDMSLRDNELTQAVELLKDNDDPDISAYYQRMGSFLETENKKIELYNKSAEKFNKTLEGFPAKLFAFMSGIKSLPIYPVN